MPTGYSRDYRSPEERFWANVEKHLNGCWLWRGTLQAHGYGSLAARGKHYSAHRFSYQLHKGEIPKGKVLDHLCRVRHCVNPDHLEVVTLVENVLRGESIAAKAARATHCPRGHPYSSENTYVRPSDGYRVCRKCRRGRAIRSFLNPADLPTEAAERLKLLRAEIAERQAQVEEIIMKYSPAGKRVLAAHKTHCFNGHLLTDENAYWRGGNKRCKTCRAEKQSKSRNKFNRQEGKKVYNTKRRKALLMEALLSS